MNPFQPDDHLHGDGDDRGDLSWNEYDWNRFLGRQSREIARFCSLYDQLSGEADHLDVIAQRMGWDEDDWTLGDEDDEPEPENFLVDEREEPTDLDPYTIHRHPVFIVGNGLLRQLYHMTELLIRTNEEKLSPSVTWRFAMVFNEIERNLLLSLQSVDVGDYLLGVIHAKMVLRAVNDALALVPAMARLAKEPERFAHESRKRFFDLREIAFRVMQDCREEDRGGFRDGE